ncbi:MAG: type VI secretion system-associated protein TagF [Proteobacteria bacterium]|nr:type VI secretion system-associated protein TagF [Pseudomonadota bacterium]
MTEAPAWHGKVTAAGDFVSRRMPEALLARCDAWLSGVMSSGQARHGDRWRQSYLTAPVLRFAWAPGVHGEAWWFGVLMPSCDSVGRYFPLLVIQQRDRPPRGREALEHLERWFDHLADAALHTLQEAASIAAFEQALQQAPPWPDSVAGAPTTALAGHWTFYAVPRQASLHESLGAPAAQDFEHALAGQSIWLRAPEHQAPIVLCRCAGLPAAHDMVDLWAGVPPA